MAVRPLGGRTGVSVLAGTVHARQPRLQVGTWKWARKAFPPSGQSASRASNSHLPLLGHADRAAENRRRAESSPRVDTRRHEPAKHFVERKAKWRPDLHRAATPDHWKNFMFSGVPSVSQPPSSVSLSCLKGRPPAIPRHRRQRLQLEWFPASPQASKDPFPARGSPESVHDPSSEACRGDAPRGYGRPPLPVRSSVHAAGQQRPAGRGRPPYNGVSEGSISDPCARIRCFRPESVLHVLKKVFVTIWLAWRARRRRSLFAL